MMAGKVALSVIMLKDGQRYTCHRITDNLFWCGYCNKGKIRIYSNRSWEKTNKECDWCHAQVASIKYF